jgi:peptide chain release factor subunit 1
MLTETSLRKINDFSAVFPVVSLYLNTEPAMGNAETHRLRLRNMLKDLPLEKDTEKIEAFFNHQYDWSGRAVAVFSCAPANFFEFIPLSIAVKDFIKVASKAEIEPLEDLLQDVNQLGVILVDKQGARLFYYHMGDLVEQEGILGNEVKHVKSGIQTSSRGVRGGITGNDRTENEIIERNLRRIRDFALRFFRTHKVNKIMLAGSSDNVSQLKASLPKQIHNVIVGTFSLSMSATHADVLNKVLQVSRQT